MECTSGGPVLSDRMAQPSICSSRSVNAAPEAAAGVPESLSDMLVMPVVVVWDVRCRNLGGCAAVYERRCQKMR